MIPPLTPTIIKLVDLLENDEVGGLYCHYTQSVWTISLTGFGWFIIYCTTIATLGSIVSHVVVTGSDRTCKIHDEKIYLSHASWWIGKKALHIIIRAPGSIIQMYLLQRLNKTPTACDLYYISGTITWCVGGPGLRERDRPRTKYASGTEAVKHIEKTTLCESIHLSLCVGLSFHLFRRIWNLALCWISRACSSLSNVDLLSP